jgi:hypothetical protein
MMAARGDWVFACPRRGVTFRTFTILGETVSGLLCVSHNQQVDGWEITWLTGVRPTVARIAGPVVYYPPPPDGALSN